MGLLQWFQPKESRERIVLKTFCWDRLLTTFDYSGSLSITVDPNQLSSDAGERAVQGIEYRVSLIVINAPSNYSICLFHSQRLSPWTGKLPSLLPPMSNSRLVQTRTKGSVVHLYNLVELSTGATFGRNWLNDHGKIFQKPGSQAQSDFPFNPCSCEHHQRYHLQSSNWSGNQFEWPFNLVSTVILTDLYNLVNDSFW